MSTEPPLKQATGVAMIETPQEAIDALPSIPVVKRDKLSRLGDKLDAAEQSGEWVELFDEYLMLAKARAFAAKPPRVKITRTKESYWHVIALLHAAHNRVIRLESEIEKISNDENRSMRVSADMQAAYAVAHRDWQVIAAVVRQADAEKRASIQRWREAKRAVRIPERDRLPQR